MKFILYTCSFLFFIQFASAFCLYNELTDSASIFAQQNGEDIPSGKAFSTRINPGEKQCCHFSNTDCSPNQGANDPAYFTIIFVHGPMSEAKRFRVECSTGGGLMIYNDSNERLASCTYADGTVANVPLIALE